jgi:SNF2 family DNA or RNA helicase
VLLLIFVSEFQNKVGRPVEKGTESGAPAEKAQMAKDKKEGLLAQTQSFVLGRSASLNIASLPPKQEVVIFCLLSPLQVMIAKL